MAYDTHGNFGYTTVSTAPIPAASGTSLIVTDATQLPATPFNVTIWPVNIQPTKSNAEILRVTNISGNTLTIVRTQEGTSARTILIGDQIANTVSAKVFTDIEAATLLLAGGTLIGTVNSRNILPSVDVTYDLGSGAFRYNNVFAALFTGSGAGLTALNAAQLTGSVPTARLPVITVSIVFADSPYTISTATYVFATATGGAITAKLPAAPATTDFTIYVKKIDSSANAVTVDGNGKNIDGATTFVLNAQYDAFGFKYNGTEWSVF